MSPSHTVDAGESEDADDIRAWHAHEELPVVVRGGLRDLSLLQPVLEVKVVLPNHNRDQDVQRPEKKYVKPERDPLEPLKWHFVGVKSNEHHKSARRWSPREDREEGGGQPNEVIGLTMSHT